MTFTACQHQVFSDISGDEVGPFMRMALKNSGGLDGIGTERRQMDRLNWSEGVCFKGRWKRVVL